MESLKLSSFPAETHLLACCAAQFAAVDSVLASLSALILHLILLISKNVMFLSFMGVEPYMNQWPKLPDYNDKGKGKAIVESDSDDGVSDDSDDGYEDSDDDDLSSDGDDGLDDSDDEEDNDDDDIGGDDDDEDDDDDDDNDDDTSDEEDDDDEEDDEDAPPNKKTE